MESPFNFLYMFIKLPEYVFFVLAGKLHNFFYNAGIHSASYFPVSASAGAEEASFTDSERTVSVPLLWQFVSDISILT